MTKISEESKQLYTSKVREYKRRIGVLLLREQRNREAIDIMAKPQIQRIMLSRERLDIASYYLLLNRISWHLLGIRSETHLNEARKSCYQSIIYLEQTIGSSIDVPFSEYAEQLDQIADYRDEDRYLMVRLLGFTIQSVEEDFGHSSKWRWSFVELYGRFVTVAKNLLDLRHVATQLDPRKPGYPIVMRYLKLLKQTMAEAALRYRRKYELTTQRSDDIRLGIKFLSALRRLHSLLRENDESEAIHKKIAVWRSKMEYDERHHDE